MVRWKKQWKHYSLDEYQNSHILQAIYLEAKTILKCSNRYFFFVSCDFIVLQPTLATTISIFYVLSYFIFHSYAAWSTTFPTRIFEKRNWITLSYLKVIFTQKLTTLLIVAARNIFITLRIAFSCVAPFWAISIINYQKSR